MVLCYQFFEAKTLDLLVLVNRVHYDFGIDTLEIGLIDGLLLMSCGFFGLEAAGDDLVDQVMGLVGKLRLDFNAVWVGKTN